MRTFLVAIFAATVLAPAALRADELEMPAGAEAEAAPAPMTLPKKGTSRAQVLKIYGEPQTRHPAVGGDSPKHPPITRWDYPGFTVIFEHAHVVDTVVPGRPAPLFHAEQLTPASPKIQ